MRQKGFDMAIECAEILKDKGLEYIWYLVGEGEDDFDFSSLDAYLKICESYNAAEELYKRIQASMAERQKEE